MRRLREAVPEASRQSEPILINTMPKFLENLAEALAPDHPRKFATEGCTVAQEHGGERARVTHYSIDSLLTEYKILRETLFDQLHASGPVSEDERAIILGSLDEAVKESALAFFMVLEGIRHQFISTLTHDLRNPLTVARANIEMILRYPEKRDQHLLLAGRAVDAIRRTDQMITDLLDATRVHAGELLSFELSEWDMVEMVEEAREELTTIHGDRFELEVSRRPIRGWWNREAIHRVLENLAQNAVKYGDPRATIKIDLREQHERVVVTVHNEGPPIPAEDQETLFRAFQRTDSARKGAQRGWGLGLALVRGVAEAHGGSIIVESTLGKGTTFGIDILLDPRKVRDPREPIPTRSENGHS